MAQQWAKPLVGERAGKWGTVKDPQTVVLSELKTAALWEVSRDGLTAALWAVH